MYTPSEENVHRIYIKEGGTFGRRKMPDEVDYYHIVALTLKVSRHHEGIDQEKSAQLVPV